mmetsp:Transcript_11049/g.19982  ORF Transcript_11049/g.19982 Transcript_11049/m.19982 type:complete len:275 (+) Transcript_11049:316-1140(+)
MVADVEGQPVEAAVVTVGLLPLVHDVVLGDEVAGNRVDPHAQERSEDEVEEALEAVEVVDDEVEGDLDGDVDLLPEAGVLGVDEERTKGIEGRLQKAPDDLERRVGEDLTLGGGGDVNIQHILALVSVVLHVVPLETGGRRDAHGEVRKEAQETVVDMLLGAEVVGKLVHRQGHHVVDRPRQRVAAEKPCPPARILQQVDAHQLNHNARQYLPLGQRAVAEQLLNLWVSLDNGSPPRGMRLISVGVPVESRGRGHNLGPLSPHGVIVLSGRSLF